MSPILASSSRWNPTPEQLMILEEMYKSGGVRTPNASQIQQITAHLSRYGKIEGKNVFYWFQNHKARDRQRLRRKLSKLQLYHNIMLHHHNHDHTTTPVTQLSHHPSSIGIFQQGGVIHNPSLHMDNSYTSKLNQIPECKFQLDDDLTIMKWYNCDWTTMLDAGPRTCTKPLETLELFPVTSSGDLKEDFITLKRFPSPSTLLPTNPQ